MNEEFEDPRLAAVYDVLDADRSDLEPYLALARRLRARRVLDVGCGTGVFALLLAHAGVDVVGVDPAGASLDVARGKPGGDRVRWIEGDAAAVDDTDFDLATMTANVAMCLLTDDDALATLSAIAARLRAGGHLAFETRRPDARAWESWDRTTTYTCADLAGGQRVESWVEMESLRWPWLDYRTVVVLADATTVASRATLRYRELGEWRELLSTAGLSVLDVADAPDRPGREWIVHARTG